MSIYESPTGYVYFVQHGIEYDGPIKIGFSGDPWKRLNQLQVASPVELRLRAVEKYATRWDEQRWHERHKESSIGGEWFSMTEQLLHDILSLAFPTFSPKWNCPDCQNVPVDKRAGWPMPSIEPPKVYA